MTQICFLDFLQTLETWWINISQNLTVLEQYRKNLYYINVKQATNKLNKKNIQVIIERY